MATTTATVEESTTRRTLDSERIGDLPSTLRRSSTVYATPNGFSHRHRHSKKLSLNFPILVPIAHDVSVTASHPLPSLTQSPTAASPYRIGTPASARLLPSPDALQDETTSPDFLTLIASQERKVMELKDELLKAESELMGLKKQWSMFEAEKKHSELRNKTVQLGPISPGTGASSAEDEDVERCRRREARERRMKELGMKEGEVFKAEVNSGKRNGGRVFAGRHTRTLSLLQNTGALAETAGNADRPKSKTESNSPAPPLASAKPATSTTFEDVENNEVKRSRPSLSRQPTLQELIASSATGTAQLTFGKTYKELAHASRKSLPPGTDVFVKQGKQVYDGVSQGFWNFVEDIRQATVGDEPVTGVPSEHRREVKRSKSNKKLAQHTCERHGRPGTKKGKNGDQHKPEKDNFWKEFGLETPKPSKHADTTISKKAAAMRVVDGPASVKDHESKSSTDSKCPPSLLADLMDINEDDEAWDSWPADSPMAQRHADRRVEIRRASDEVDSSNGQAEPGTITNKNYRPMEASWAELTT